MFFRVLSVFPRFKEVFTFLPATFQSGDTLSEAEYWIPFSSMVLSRFALLALRAVITPGVKLARRLRKGPSPASGRKAKRKFKLRCRFVCFTSENDRLEALALMPMDALGPSMG